MLEPREATAPLDSREALERTDNEEKDNRDLLGLPDRPDLLDKMEALVKTELPDNRAHLDPRDPQET